MRIGLDNIYGYITDVKDLDIELKTVDILSLDEMKTYIGREGAQIVDVRGITEYEAGHVNGAEHAFVGTLPSNLDKISKDKQVIIHCQAGDRSAIAHSILVQNGFENVKNFSGGMKEWIEAGEEIIANEKICCSAVGS